MKVDRKWTKREVDEMVDKALELDKPNIANAIKTGYLFGMGLYQVVGFRRHYVERALREKRILILGRTRQEKPHLVRLTPEMEDFLREIIKDVPRGYMVFCPMDVKPQKFRKQLTGFIANHRDSIQDSDRAKSAHNLISGDRAPLTFEGFTQ